jgi:hypothetical protein
VRSFKFKISETCGLFLAFLSVAVPACGQQDSSSKPEDNQPRPAGSTAPWIPRGDGSSAAETDATPAAGTPIDMQRRVIGTAVPYAGAQTPLRWGPFSVNGFQFLNVHDSYDPGNGLPQTNLNFGLLTADLAFNRTFHKSNFNLQYTPQVAFLNGQVTANGSTNNEVDLGTTFQLSPRTYLLVRNQFSRNTIHQIFADDVLNVYQGVAGLLPGNFLENSGTYLEDAVTVAVSYQLSPRWTITTAPMFRYISLTNSGAQYSATGNDIRNATALTYALTPRSNLGFVYTFEASLTVKPAPLDNFFHGGAIFYAQQLTRTIGFQGQFGAQVAFNDGAPLPVWLYTGNFAAVKNFSVGVFAINYNRQNELVNYLANRLSEREDITYSVPLLKHLFWKNGLGYYREVGSPPHTQGKYALTTVEYSLPAGFVLFGNYAYRFQRAETAQLLSGTHNTMRFGIRWEPKLLKKNQ